MITFSSLHARLFAVAVLRLVQFLKFYTSQGSVATCVGCGSIFIANFPQNVSVK